MALQLGILGSTRGTDLQAIIDAIGAGQLDAVIKVVLSNKEQAYILERAKGYQIPALFIDPKGLARADYDEKINLILQKNQIDLVVLIGYMRILSDEFISTWRNKIINVHPSLLPDFAGGMDQNIHQAVLNSGKKETGCTVHYVTEEVDGGPILLQKKCKVFPNDTVETLKTRVQALEGEALIEVIRSHLLN